MLIFCVLKMLRDRHDVAEVADLASMAFGDDEELKQVLVCKKVRLNTHRVI